MILFHLQKIRKNKMKSKLILFGGIFILLFSISFWVNHKFIDFRNEITHWQNEAAQKDTVTIIDSTGYEKLALQVDKLSSRNKDLQKELKKKDAKIQSQINIIGALEDSIKNVSTQDSIINDSIKIRTFDINIDAFNIVGYFQKQSPYEISFTKLLAKFNLEANIVENKDKSWSAYIDTDNPSLKITNINTKVILYTPSFREKLNFGAGIYLSDKFSSLHGLIGYNRYILQIGYTTNGIGIGANYKW